MGIRSFILLKDTVGAFDDKEIASTIKYNVQAR